MVTPGPYRVQWRNPDLSRRGIVPYDTMTFVPRFNAGGTWQFQLDTAQDAAGWIAPGGGVIIDSEDNPGVTLLSGPVRNIQEDLAEGTPGETLTVSGVDDTARLANRLIFPDPTVALSAQSDSHYITTGTLEAVMRMLVDLNAGPSALVARRITGLSLAPNGELGPATTTAARFASLLDYLAALCLTGGLGFRVVQVGSGLQFGVYEPRDVSATAKFSADLGNLRAYSYTATAPTVTDAIVGDKGVGGARLYVERTDTASETDWQERFEGFVDRSDIDGTVDPLTLQDSGDQAIVAGGPRASLSLTPLDTPDLRFGLDYGLGDVVTVVTRGGPVIDVVREVTVTVGALGADVAPLIGSPNAQSPDEDARLYGLIRALIAKTQQLEQGN